MSPQPPLAPSPTSQSAPLSAPLSAPTPSAPTPCESGLPASPDHFDHPELFALPPSLPPTQNWWNSARQELQKQLGDAWCERWLTESELERTLDHELQLVVRDDTAQLWLETNHLEDLQKALHQAGADQPLSAVCSAKEAPLRQAARAHRAPTPSQELAEPTQAPFAPLAPAPNPAPPHQPNSQELRQRITSLGIDPDHSFDAFVVGDNSRFAHAASQAVSQGGRDGCNPLFIYGTSGVGKTHLISAIAQEYLTRKPEARVLFLHAENFCNQFINALRNHQLEKFREKTRSLDMLLLDEVQFLAGKERTQEEFFHAFNSLAGNRTHIILTSDRPAAETQSFSPRLKSRFESGLTVNLLPPGYETRVAILRHLMDRSPVTLSDPILCHIAERIQSNVRRLLGSFNRIASQIHLDPTPMTTERVDALLQDFIRDESTKSVTLDRVQKIISDYYDLRVEDMYSKRRPKRIAYPRQIAMTLAREFTRHSYKEIGSAFGGRDHGTVIYAERKITKDAQHDPTFARELDEIRTLLTR